ncbi:uncharacterized protein SCODWIG_02939 [Saccharomycodes ludwigii]|uniref:Uncharacterized protein n=1 Tax=Saccharomycodes ludwigii TaxID=36035 RepID=A0A376B916_9ASCO|nr:hypothetical protein SCDLUD_000193 [Saccharomycodes ludwigii]KAH3902613.1 hypothetical protein SCDLUD_000193 [Saccharomycodes ludwigii]SSD61178.1 uncharacterized protein SCODWIG_02939 [Saccharomycodes ludwigii]
MTAVEQDKELIKLQKELTKALNRKEELSKQYNTLNKDFSTLLRKTTSLIQIFEVLGEEEVNKMVQLDEQLIPSHIITKFPALEKYNELIQKIDGENPITDAKIKDLPIDIYKMYDIYEKTPLLYKDALTDK